MSTPLSFLQEVLLLGLLLIASFYFLHFRIWAGLAPGADLFFVLALSVSIASITFPPPFEWIADRFVARSAIPTALEAADSKAEFLEALPQELFRQALAKIGMEPDEPHTTSESSDDSDPSDPSDTSTGASKSAERIALGPVSQLVRPPLRHVLSDGFRVASFIASSFLFPISMLMRSSGRTSRRLAELEGRIESVETSLGSTSSLPNPLADNLHAD